MTDAVRLAAAAVSALLLPVFTSWAQALLLLLVVVVLATSLALGLTALRRQRRRTDPEPDRLDAQPLLPGESRFVVSADGVVTESLPDPLSVGFRPGEIVGRPVADFYATPAIEAAWRRALDDHEGATYRHDLPAADGAVHAHKVTLLPRADGTVYGEAWDVSEYAAEADRLAAALAQTTAQRDRLMAHATADAIALARPAAAADVP